MTAGYRCEPAPRGVVMVNGRMEPAPEGVVFVRDDRSREQLFEEARGAFGFDVSPFLGNELSPVVAEHVEESIAAALSRAAGEPVEVSGARLDGTKVHVNARMSRELAEKLGLVPSIPTFLEFFEALRAARPLLAASAVELTEDRLHILCPASATFDAAGARGVSQVTIAAAGASVTVTPKPPALPVSAACPHCGKP